jgi:broad specificity phosphatase PhoE
VRTLLLARHGLAASNLDGGTASSAVPGAGLAEEGVEQARRLGVELADEQIDLGVATELLRTRETLELALAGRDVPVVVVPELNEIRFGRFDGGRLAAYREWAGGERPDTHAPGGGESRAFAAARFARGLRILLARKEEVILAIGHALPVRYVLDAAQGLVPAPLLQAPVPHGVATRLDAGEVEAAAALLEEWSREPRFRTPSIED